MIGLGFEFGLVWCGSVWSGSGWFSFWSGLAWLGLAWFEFVLFFVSFCVSFCSLEVIFNGSVPSCFVLFCFSSLVRFYPLILVLVFSWV